MTFSVNNFKTSGLRRGGYRPSLFDVLIPRSGNNLNFLARASNVPAMTVEPIEVPYFGRTIKLAGNRTYAEWTTTIMMDEDFGVRDALEEWSININSAEPNIREYATQSALKEDAVIRLFSKTGGSAIRTYNLIGLWPQEVGTIELSWDSNDVGTFDVTWAFDYMDKGS